LDRLQFTQEEIDHCQDTLAYTTRDPQTLGGEEGTSAALADGLLTSLGASRDTGITRFAASQGAHALSNLAGLKSSLSSSVAAGRRKALRRHLLQGGSSASGAIDDLADATALAQVRSGHYFDAAVNNISAMCAMIASMILPLYILNAF
jgi:hypothetical protein